MEQEILAVNPACHERAPPALADKVAFLRRPASYAGAAEVAARETHMSWVFLVGDDAYKLKKPVRFPYLDFSTLPRRERACRAEVALNRRLAPDVYLGVLPLTADNGMALGGAGEPVDWLVHMRRLDERFMLDRMIGEGRLIAKDIDRLADVLAAFYRRAEPVMLPPAVHLAETRRMLALNRSVLLDPRFGLPAGHVRQIDAALERFVVQCGGLIAARLRERRVVDGHGDLRPEHIFLGERIRVIDCLEFNARLRVVDPFDEIAYLALECERLGAAWAGARLRRRMTRLLRDGPAEPLFTFYSAYRAMLRARLAIAHLDEEPPRTPEKWPLLARHYLALAAQSACGLEAWLRIRTGRSGCGSRKAAGSRRPKAARRAGRRACPTAA
jgi:aminoglycoside phosphotransferase family enzyme